MIDPRTGEGPKRPAPARPVRPVRPPAVDARRIRARGAVLRTLDPDGRDPEPLAALDRTLGAPVRFLGLSPPGEPDPPEPAWCVHLRSASDGPLRLRLDAPTASRLAAEALGVEPWEIDSGTGSEPIAGVLTVLALRALEAWTGSGAPVAFEDLHLAGGEDPSGFVRVRVRLRLGDRVVRISVGVPARPDEAERPRRGVLPDDLPIPLAAVVAVGRVPRRDLTALRIGDALTFDRTAASSGAGEGGLWLGSARTTAGPWWAVHDEGPAGARIVRGPTTPWNRPENAIMNEGEPSDRTAVDLSVDLSRDDRDALLDEVPVEVTAVAGRVTLPLGRLADLGPGELVPLGRSPGGWIELTANGLPFARGRLVDLDGELAVEVVELRGRVARASDAVSGQAGGESG